MFQRSAAFVLGAAMFCVVSLLNVIKDRRVGRVGVRRDEQRSERSAPDVRSRRVEDHPRREKRP